MALSLDGSVAVFGQTGTSVVTGSLTCSNAGNVIVVGIVSNGSDVSSITGGGVTFTNRGKASTGSNYTETWSGYASGTFNSAITVNFNSSSSFATIHAFGVNGAPSSNYFDTHASLPSIGSTLPGSVSTTATNTFIFALIRATDDENPAIGAGSWTAIEGLTGDGYALTEYQIVGASQSGLSVTATMHIGDSEHIISDAIIQGGTNTNLPVTKADLQPSGSAIAFASLMALSPASFAIDGQVVALQWQQDTLTISVDAAAISVAVGTIDGRRGTPVVTASPTISGQNILFQLSSGDWTLPVDVGTPTILGQNIALEKNQFFDRGAPLLTGSSIALSEGAVVVSAAPSIAGQDVTLSWSQGTLGVLTASFDIDGQEIALNKTWSVSVDVASFDIDGQNVIFDWVVTSTIVVESTPFSVSGSNLTLARHIPITSTALSPAGQSIARGDGTIVDTTFIAVTPQNVDFIYDYPFGYAFDAAEFGFTGRDVVLYLGSGAPTRFRSSILKDRIQIAFSIPQTHKTTATRRIRG